VVHVPGGVAEVLPVRAAGHVQPAPQRLARHRDEQRALGHAGHLGHRVLGVGDMLEDLDGRRGVELAIGEGQVLGLHDAVLEVGRRPLGPLGVQGRIVEVDADHAALVAQALGPLMGQHALAAAHVEQRLRVGLREELVERALEAGHEAPDDGVRRAVLVVGVAGDRALTVDGDAAHREDSLSGSPLGMDEQWRAVIASRPRAPRSSGPPARRSSPAGRSAGRPARSATAARRAAARCAARARRCAGT
jgi:hypothetical protein